MPIVTYISVALSILSFILLIILFLRNPQAGNKEITTQFAVIERNQERLERSLKDEISKNREEMLLSAKALRQEVSSSLLTLNESMMRRLSESLQSQLGQLDSFSKQLQLMTQANEERLGKLNETVASQLKSLQDDNNQKLEKMRETVDEKLNATLATRLDNSFKQVGDQLQLLYKSLGQMQVLAGGVSDLNRVLTNVKARGTWGEVQLGNLLEQTMTSDQYEKNVATKKGSDARVEYAVKLPGKDDSKNCVWLPIDAKFAQEDYLKILDAAERADAAGVEEASKALENRVKLDARTIRDKYIAPPATTDFAIMFLPTEGLYAEVLRRPGLADYCQTTCRVMIAGPTTLTALLNSLRMGFATLAIEKKSSEVWKLLRAIKSQYTTFNELLDKSLKKIGEAQTSMENVKNRSELINRKLGKVEELDMTDAEKVLGLDEGRAASEE
jgi:DNA recombination protein RmuC